MVGILTLHLHVPGCSSLKEKRSRLKPLLARLHREFNVSTAEMDLLEKWQETVIACGMVGNNNIHLEQSLQSILAWIENNRMDLQVMNEKIELF
jgi:uncharacterized protein YlxP (DUF503 family)